ncbi:hypothetical protein QWY20_15680 [Alkalimonas sp. MEB108]|uniref:Glyoxalase/bleomycin resistance protein/dioxygenase n=1 Tax=Alkalimonas cellulosilytica TaxID=3058395 RepID=A0ABU7J993_9GAMM|nr:hypothetical protein [Alkalimonas sp. MEB108]MEE2002897.1 hypothetical protein [Alkalimonas sp. MEB108]
MSSQLENLSGPQLGPILGATLVTANLERVRQAYCQQLGFSLVREARVSPQLADFWQAPACADQPMLILAAANGDAWLRVIQMPSEQDIQPVQPLKRQGWMALEVNVADVEAVRHTIQTDEFAIIGEPAYLQISDAIKAMQLIGPAEEVSYLTEVQRPVPPFQLPQTNSFSGSLFIPVLAVPDRQQAVDFYQQLNQAEPALLFDTKITVLNKAWQRPIEHQYPVATLQLAGNSLFEIDQLPEAEPLQTATGQLPSGIAMISCITRDLDGIAKRMNATIHSLDDPYYPASRAILLKGSAGELIELVQAC